MGWSRNGRLVRWEEPGGAAITHHCEALRARKDLMEQHFSVSHQQTNKHRLNLELYVNWHVSLYMEYPEAFTSQGCLGSKTLLKRESVRVEIFPTVVGSSRFTGVGVTSPPRVKEKLYSAFFFHKPYSSMLRSQKSQFALVLLIYFTDYSKYTIICYEMCLFFFVFFLNQGTVKG